MDSTQHIWDPWPETKVTALEFPSWDISQGKLSLLDRRASWFLNHSSTAAGLGNYLLGNLEYIKEMHLIRISDFYIALSRW